MKFFNTLFLSMLLTTVSFAETATELVSSGDFAFQQGQFQQAITYWKQALPKTPEKGKKIELFIRLATAYRFFGLPENALQALKEALTLAQKSGEQIRQAIVLTSISELHLLTGKLEVAKITADKSVEIARQFPWQPLVLANALNHRGTVWSLHENTEDALQDYQESFILVQQHGSNIRLKATVLINQLRAILQAENADWLDDDWLDEALPTFEDALAQISQLPASYDKAMKLLSLAQMGIAIQREESIETPSQFIPTLSEIIHHALQLAHKLQDNRLQSYAYGYLGELSEITGCFSKVVFRKLTENKQQCFNALSLTRRALFFANKTTSFNYFNSLDALYRWQWQMGRLLNVQGDVQKAIEYYQAAVKTLDKIRSALTSSYLVTAKGFRQSVQPVYFGLVDLLLQQATQAKKQRQQYLRREAIRAIETFKQAELENYFKEDCITASEVNLATVINNTEKKYPTEFSDNTAVLYPIILPKRIELLLLFPNRIEQKTIPVKKAHLKREIKKLRRSVEPLGGKTLRQFDKNRAYHLYQWLIQPIETELVGIKTLVIVPHDILLTLPFAALYDGKHKQYLIEKPYTLVISLGFLSNPQVPSKKVEILLGGLSEAVGEFDALLHVQTEIDKIHHIYQGTAPLLNSDFTINRLKEALKIIPYTVVHLASHAKFNRNPAQSFILTYEADNKLTMKHLERLSQFRQEPLELLTLSACQTAKSDDERAALGLAGVAVKASARSVLATYWWVDDLATSKLMPAFYRQLQNVSKAQALQNVQRHFLSQKEYEHPYYWAGFVLSGNWLQ
jgi:CHAT domain-containing protein